MGILKSLPLRVGRGLNGMTGRAQGLVGLSVHPGTLLLLLNHCLPGQGRHTFPKNYFTALCCCRANAASATGCPRSHPWLLRYRYWMWLSHNTVSFRCPASWFDICTYCEMITTISLVTITTTHSYRLFFLWWELWRSSLLATFTYTTQWCWPQSPCCTYIPRACVSYSWKFVPFDPLRPFHQPPQHPASDNHHPVLCFYEFGLFFQLHKWGCIFLYLTYFT